MKKYITLIFATLFIVNISFSQNFVAPTCSCVKPSNATCNSTCTFSDCCICFNPTTQNGACGCYWGVATCRSENTTSNSSLSSTNFGTLNPNAKISFSFEKFNLLFDFFRSKEISPVEMENVFTGIRPNYALTGSKVLIDNNDFGRLLSEYSKLIDRLDPKQKEDLNNYIKSIK